MIVIPKGDKMPRRTGTTNVRESGLVSLWKFDGLGSVAIDNGNAGNHGHINAATRVNGKIGGALSFTSGDYALILDDASINFGNSNDFSIICWIKTSNDGSLMCIVDKSNLSSPQNGYALYRGTNNKVTLDYYDGSSPSPQLVSTSTITDGAYHFVAVTWKADNSARKLYFDRTAEDSEASQSNSGEDSAYNLAIGARGSDQTYSFIGDIDNVRIFDRALSQSEIFKIYDDEV